MGENFQYQLFTKDELLIPVRQGGINQVFRKLDYLLHYVGRLYDVSSPAKASNYASLLGTQLACILFRFSLSIWIRRPDSTSMVNIESLIMRNLVAQENYTIICPVA